MRTIERTTQFKRDYKRISKGLIAMCWARTSWPSSQHYPKISHWTDGTTTTLLQANGMTIEIGTSDLIWC
jgi:hypothetical protein